MPSIHYGLKHGKNYVKAVLPFESEEKSIVYYPTRLHLLLVLALAHCEMICIVALLCTKLKFHFNFSNNLSNCQNFMNW